MTRLSERIAADVLKASGSGLQNYTMNGSRERIIAAASVADDLLEMLQQLEYWFNTDAEILDAMTEAERADHIRQHEKIRKAIAKALGEQA